MKLSHFFLVPVIVYAAPTSSIGSTVQLQEGLIQGSPRDANGILAFKGIPYAQPPVGDLRWRSPSPATPWQGVINATQFGYTCWGSSPTQPNFTPENENCLTLNIWTGAVSTTENRPVMVWIYGGGFQYGGSATPVYNGENFAQLGVILVTVNYRTGVFGFLAHPELDLEGSFSGNFGLQDQLFALKWVRANIAAFGGNPEDITFFGESAGAMSMGLLMTSPKAPGLFQKTILESGAYWDSEHGDLPTFTEARARGLAYQQSFGATSIDALRALSAADANNGGYWDSTTDPAVTAFAPSIDYNVLVDIPARIFDQGLQLHIPMLIGYNSDEELIFETRDLPHSSAAAFTSAMDSYFGPAAPAALTLYPAPNASAATTSANVLIGDLIIREQTWEAATTHARTTSQPVYLYYFSYQSPYSPLAYHTSELPFVFGNLGPNHFIPGPPPTAQDHAMSALMMAYWTNFAKQGNPNAEGLEAWPLYEGAGARADVMGLGDVVQPVEYDFSRFEFIQSLRVNGALPASWRELNVTAGTY